MTSIECPLRAAALDSPQLPALEAPERRFTYFELDALVESAAAQIRAIEPKESARVAFQCDNSWRFVVLFLATLRAGVTACPLSTRLPDAAVRKQAADLGAARLVTDLNGFPLSESPVGGPIDIPEDRPSTIVFTSGSTGRAKGALHTFGNHYYSAVGSNKNIAVAPGDRWLLSLPLYHVGGIAILFRCLIGRAAVILPKKEWPLREAVSRATHVSMVSTQLRRFLDDGGAVPPKAMLLGGSAIPRSLIQRAYDAGLPIHTSYGMTEMASQVTATSPGASLKALLSSGRPLPFRELLLSSESEILVRGRTRFVGYVEGDQIIAPFNEDGWFATRDVGTLDDEGLLHVTGRLDNVFISGGENIMPEEIEATLESLPEVRRSMVVPVGNEEFGFRPVAFLETAMGVLDESGIRARLAEVLPRFKIPDRFFLWPAIAESTGMKTDRTYFRELAEKLVSATR